MGDDSAIKFYINSELLASFEQGEIYAKFYIPEGKYEIKAYVSLKGFDPFRLEQRKGGFIAIWDENGQKKLENRKRYYFLFDFYFGNGSAYFEEISAIDARDYIKSYERIR